VDCSRAMNRVRNRCAFALDVEMGTGRVFMPPPFDGCHPLPRLRRVAALGTPWKSKRYEAAPVPFLLASASGCKVGHAAFSITKCSAVGPSLWTRGVLPFLPLHVPELATLLTPSRLPVRFV
jgi:hypothetical protein